MEELRFPYVSAISIGSQWLCQLLQEQIWSRSPLDHIELLLIWEAMYAILFPLRFPLSLHPRFYLTANFGPLMSVENCRLQN